MENIVIEAGEIRLTAELDDSTTAKEIIAALPIEGRANTWGDEIYFEIPVEVELVADARADVTVGEIGYWPTGSAFCIFFGPTPASTGDAPRAASPVNVFGRIIGDASDLKKVQDGNTIRLTAAGSN